MSYYEDARSDAKDTAIYFLDEIVNSFIGEGKASDDLLNDYSCSYHHEHHVAKYYSLKEAAEVLEELSDHKETDNGLWEGLEPIEAVGAQAAYTYGNAVYSLFQELIQEINEDDETNELLLDSEEETSEDTVIETEPLSNNELNDSIKDRIKEIINNF